VNPWRGLRGLPRGVWVLCAATLVNRAGMMVLPFLVLYLTRSLGFSSGRSALVLTLYGVGSLVTTPLSGRLCDRIGPLRVMRFSLFLAGAILVAFAAARSYAAIVGLVVAWAVAGEAFRPASMAHITDVVPPEKRKQAFALYRLAINLGMSVGPALGGFLATASFPALILVDAGTTLAAGAVLAVAGGHAAARGAGGGVGAPRGASDPASAAPAPPDGARAAAPADRAAVAVASARARLFYFLAATIPVSIVFFQHEAAMPLYLVRDLGIPEVLYGALFTVNTILIILIEVPLNGAMARWPHRRALALGALLVGAGFGALALATRFPAVVGTVVVWTFGEMILLPACAAYVAEIAPAARRGEFMGLYAMSFSLAFTVAPWLGVAVLDRFGAAAVWGGALACGALSAAMMLRIGRRGHALRPLPGSA
jgi:MFS family permease